MGGQRTAFAVSRDAGGTSFAQDLLSTAPPAATSAAPASRELFQDLVASGRGSVAVGRAVPLSVVLHTAGLALLILAPLWTTVAPPPPQRDYVRALLYDPPPPPPPPLPKGRGLVDRMSRTSDARAPQATPAFTAPSEPAAPESPSTAASDEVASDAGGSPTGSEQGVPEGMEGGQIGGVVGGVPGGVLGGVLGGTGTVPVPVTSYDRPPRLLRMIKPDYPSEAFVKKIQGVVSVEILIDAGGRVVRARIVRSVPELDAAALDAVRQWVFSPAVKAGQPVATLALAPVTFTLY